MKAKFAVWLKSLTGRLDDIVFCRDKKSDTVWVREYVTPELTTHNHYMGNVAKNLSQFKKLLSEGYLSDLRIYSDRYNLKTIDEKGRSSSFALLFKMMFALKRAVPNVDLETIIPMDVIDSDLPVKTIREAVEYGFLPIVTRYEELDNLIANGI